MKIEDLEALETVDIDDVELFKTGTYRGREYTEEDLDIMASSYTELPHYHRPLKIGHEEDQPLTKTSGMPALGWVENVRRVGNVLRGDYKKVMKTAAQIVKSGGYRTSSAEIVHDFTDPVTGKTFKHAYRAQALLGATFPQIKNLSDVVALYSEDVMEAETNVEVIQISDFSETTSLRLANIEAQVDAIHRILTPEGKQGGDEFMERAQLIEALGLGEDVTDDAILASIKDFKTKAEEPPTAEVFTDKEFFMDTRSDAYKTLVSDASAGREALKNQKEADKKSALKGAIEEGKILPTAYEKWAEMYDKDPAGTVELLATIEAKPERFQERGGDLGGDEQRRTGQKTIEEQIEAFMEENPEKTYSEAYDHVIRENKDNQIKEVRS